MLLYRAIELPSDEPVQYVGCYVLKWGKIPEPTIGFVEVEEDQLTKFANLCRQYPNEAVLTLLEMALNEVIEPQAELSQAEHDAWPAISRIV